MRRAKVYEITRKKPKFSWKKLTIRHAVYEALKELKRADVPKIIGSVLASGIETKQANRDKQIRYTLWEFCRDGIAREREDRRWRPRADVPPSGRGRKKKCEDPLTSVG